MPYDLSSATAYHVDAGHALGDGLTLADDSLGTVLVPSSHNQLLARDTVDNKLRWSFAVTATVTGAPALGSDGRVFFGAHNGQFFALNLADGSKVWSRNLGGSADSAPR